MTRDRRRRVKRCQLGLLIPFTGVWFDMRSYCIARPMGPVPCLLGTQTGCQNKDNNENMYIIVKKQTGVFQGSDRYMY